MPAILEGSPDLACRIRLSSMLGTLHKASRPKQLQIRNWRSFHNTCTKILSNGSISRWWTLKLRLQVSKVTISRVFKLSKPSMNSSQANKSTLCLVTLKVELVVSKRAECYPLARIQANSKSRQKASKRLEAHSSAPWTKCSSNSMANKSPLVQTSSSSSLVISYLTIQQPWRVYRRQTTLFRLLVTTHSLLTCSKSWHLTQYSQVRNQVISKYNQRRKW